MHTILVGKNLSPAKIYNTPICRTGVTRRSDVQKCGKPGQSRHPFEIGAMVRDLNAVTRNAWITH